MGVKRDGTMMRWIAGTVFGRSNEQGFGQHIPIRRASMSGNETLTTQSPQIQSLDAGGSARNLDLPAEDEGLWFLLARRDTGTDDITVRNDAGGTLGVLEPDTAALCVSDGTGWIMLGSVGMTSLDQT